MVRVKGNAALGAATWIRKTFGEEAFGRVLAAMPAEAAALYRGKLLRNTWYPFESYRDLLKSLESTIGTGDGQLCRRMGAEVADADFPILFRAFLMLFATPSLVAAKANMIWRNYYSDGDFVPIDSGALFVTNEVKGFPEPHRFLCAAIEGFVERSIALTRVKDPKGSHPRCRARGDALCEFRVEWKP